MEKLQKVEYLIIHHTQRNNDFPLFVKLRHKYLRGWEDTGYHYLIGNTRPFSVDGKLYLGRSEIYQGAHTYGYNNCSLGISLIGDFNKNVPSKKQLGTLFSFLEDRLNFYNLDIKSLRGHNEFINKSCPGKFVDMDYIRQVVSGNEIFSYSYYIELQKEKFKILNSVEI